MKLKISVCVFVDDGDDRDGSRQPALSRNPLDDLIARMRREVQYGRESARERITDGTKVS